MADDRREGSTARLGDDQDAAPRVGGVDLAPHLSGVDGGLNESTRPWLVDADGCSEVADRTRPVVREHDEQPHRGMAAAAARSTVAAVPTPPAVLVVRVVGLITEGTPVPVVPPEPRAGRARAERPAEPSATECAERSLDRCDRVGGVET